MMVREQDVYQRGHTTWFTSEKDGGPDVGIAVGLGAGMALYAGDLPNPHTHGLKLYSANAAFPTDVIATQLDEEGSRRLIDALASVLLSPNPARLADVIWMNLAADDGAHAAPGPKLCIDREQLCSAVRMALDEVCSDKAGDAK